jgi:hypothetical protein
MSGDLALVTLGVATAVEILGDKVPVVDHVLDAIGTVVRPMAAWVGAYAVLSAWPTPWGQIASVALGTVAVGVHVLKAKLRIGSSITTAGTANPVISIGEDVSALATSVLAIVAPIVIALVLVLFAIVLVRRGRALPPPAHGDRPTPLSSRP